MNGTEAREGILSSSVADSDPNPYQVPSDPYVFWPPGSGSGSISQRYGYGSLRKTLISTAL
jgi:hypothetical protein